MGISIEGRLMKKLWIVQMCLLSIFVITGCDHTELEGKVVVVNEDVLRVGQDIPLTLTVPEKLDEIHGVEWLLNDSEGELIYDSNVLMVGDALIDEYDDVWIKESFSMDDIDKERIAVFRPIESGTYTIEVSGFYKQTNPQPITEIILIIED